MTNYYEILEINPSATSSEIKAAYKKLVKQYHPDIYKGEDRIEKFKSIQSAYETLSNEEKRARYDQIGHESYSHQEKYSNGYSSYRDVNGFDDFGKYVNVKFKSFSDLKWYTKILLVLLGILAIGVIIVIGIIWLIYLLIKTIVNAIIE